MRTRAVPGCNSSPFLVMAASAAIHDNRKRLSVNVEVLAICVLLQSP
jgi:hypothetical protein